MLLRTITTREEMLAPPRKRAGEHVTARCSTRESSEHSPLAESERRAITNLIEYIDLYEVPSGLRVQLKLSSYRLVVTTRTSLPLDLYFDTPLPREPTT
jgi:hypothetical protein